MQKRTHWSNLLLQSLVLLDLGTILIVAQGRSNVVVGVIHQPEGNKDPAKTVKFRFQLSTR